MVLTVDKLREGGGGGLLSKSRLGVVAHKVACLRISGCPHTPRLAANHRLLFLFRAV